MSVPVAMQLLHKLLGHVRIKASELQIAPERSLGSSASKTSVRFNEAQGSKAYSPTVPDAVSHTLAGPHRYDFHFPQKHKNEALG